jgi:hypothetical protein
MTSVAQSILGVNTRFGALDYKGLTECNFDSITSFMDYDAVIIDTESLAEKFNTPYLGSTYNGKLSLSQDDSFKMKEAFDRIKTQIIELLKQGKTIFILLANNESCFVHTGRKAFSGTGRNARTTNYVEEFDVFSFLPFTFRPTIARGEKYDAVCQPPYSSFFQSTRGLFYYDAYFTAPKELTLLTLHKSDNAISAVFEYEKGKIVVLPRPYIGGNYKTEEAWKKYGKKYLDALFELNRALSSCVDSYELPAWANDIKVLNEQDEEVKLEQEINKLRTVEAAIQKRKESIRKIKQKKILITGSGTPLEEVVKETLREIGFVLHEAEAGRSDIIASYNGVDVVAEIKGVSKSAAEKHAAQLEKWVAQFIEEKDHHPKALLIVNGYCDTPLSARTDEVFPDQMLKYCKSREHALITTTQLLCLYIEIKNNPTCAKERITELLSCVGKYSRYLDYKKYLRLIENEENKDNV